MITLRSETHPISSESDIVKVRQRVRAWAVECRFSLVEQTKVITASSELARNTLVYGRGGQMTIEAISEEPNTGLRLTFEDQGPGIPDIELALKDGFTTGSGMGYGLPGARRLANEFQIESIVGKGTKVMIIKWRGR